MYKRQLRNWAKITLNLSSEAAVKLKNVSYLIYNESQLASISYKDAGKLNIPNQDFYAPQNEPEDVYKRQILENDLLHFN